MQELDHWIEAEVFEKLYAIWQESQDGKLDTSASEVKKAIRAKVLQSYRNGHAAGPRVSKQPQRGGR